MARAHRWWPRSPHPPKAGIADSSETHRRSEAGEGGLRRVGARGQGPQSRGADREPKRVGLKPQPHPPAHRPPPRRSTPQFADRIGSCGWRAIETAVAQAIATHDPHLLQTREQHGRDAWGVRLFHRGVGTDGADDWVGTSHLEVTGDTLDLTTLSRPGL